MNNKYDFFLLGKKYPLIFDNVPPEDFIALEREITKEMEFLFNFDISSKIDREVAFLVILLNFMQKKMHLEEETFCCHAINCMMLKIDSSLK